jgi:hypothetical protein
MVDDMKAPWDELLTDIREHKANMKEAVASCWEDATAVLG